MEIEILQDHDITVTFTVPACSEKEAKDTIIKWLWDICRIPCLAYEVESEQDKRLDHASVRG